MSAKSKFQLQVLREYGLLVTFDGKTPVEFEGAEYGPPRETFSKWTRRVLDREASEVGVLLEAAPDGRKLVAKMAGEGDQATIRSLLKEQRDAGRAAGEEARVAEAQLKLSAQRRLKAVEVRNRDLLAGHMSSLGEAKAKTDRELCRLLGQEVDEFLAEDDKSLDVLVSNQAQKISKGLSDGIDIQTMLASLFDFVGKIREEAAKADVRNGELVAENQRLKSLLLGKD